jgi:hypothetical protein
MEMRMERTPLVALGLFVLGAILLGVGSSMTAGASLSSPPNNEGGQSLIALGLSFIVVAVGLFLAWGAPRPS